jgi:hypothetical protein
MLKWRGMDGARIEPHMPEIIQGPRCTSRQPSVHKHRPKMEGAASAHKLDQLPPEMIEFTLLKTAGALAPRVGCLSLGGRKTILTPAFIGNTSRGVIPHVSQDNFRTSVDVNGVYVPLEDCKSV